ncbi:FecR domain-containing protein [Reyranella soli]|uniref:FecR protein domain-containing protein n=1 Tax=Reyranella soli TaxID=1230389 RepID=A0A512NFN9_9HYPH|nr:FecR domain-containing protein [Reyranella soli]GEP57757.1 hypothetical protein RSO01_49230 [Reyranella soli]
MARSVLVRASLVRAVLLGTTVLAVFTSPFTIGEASAKVGVTSAADGDPLGKPPNENERVLRIGIDIQANEVVTTGTNDRAHLVFLDGSSLTVGPDARLTIDKFVFDPTTKTGELAVSAGKGVFRLVGGKISKTNPITITTPSATIGIRGGITIFSVTQAKTSADFVFGNNMSVTAAGQTQVATRPGSQIVANAGSPPGAPTMIKQGGLSAALGQLEGKSSPSSSSGGSGGNADQTAQKSGFSNVNSGQSFNPPNFNQGLPLNSNNNVTTSVLSNTASEPRPGLITPTSPPTQPVTTPFTPTPSPGPTTNQNTNPPPPPPPPSGPTKTSQTLTGFASGLVIITRGGGGESSYHHGSGRVRTLSQGSTVSITTNAANDQAQGTIVVPGLRGGTAQLELGGAGRSSFADDKSYAMLTTNDPSRPSTFTTASQSQPLPNNTVLVSGGQIPGCTCEYLTWGVWASSFTDPRNSNRSYETIGHYVAGKLTSAVQMPTTGTATYNGGMAGFVRDHGNTRVGTGNFQLNWNFANRGGNFAGGFDGKNFSGTMNAGAATPQNYNGTVRGSGVSGRVDGAFAQSPSDSAAYTLGNFSLNGRHYNASGVYAGQR